MAFRPWLRILELAILCSLIGVAGMAVVGFATLAWAAKLLLLGGLAIVSLVLAVFALIVALSSIVPLRRREFGDWL